MASVPGGQYTLFANGNNMNVVATPDGVGMPPPLAGLFNLELLTSGSGSSSIPAGYQGLAMLSPDGKTINLVSGDYGVQVASGGPHTVIAGTGDAGQLTKRHRQVGQVAEHERAGHGGKGALTERQPKRAAAH